MWLITVSEIKKYPKGKDGGNRKVIQCREISKHAENKGGDKIIRWKKT